MVTHKNLNECEVFLMKAVDNYLVNSNLHNESYTATSVHSCFSTINGMLRVLCDFELSKCQARLDFNPRSIECESAL